VTGVQTCALPISDAVAWMTRNVTDPVLARYSAVAMQHETTAILQEKPAPRLEKLKQILGVNQVDAVSTKIKEDVKETEGEIQDLETEIRTLKDREYHYLDEPELPDIEQAKTRLKQLEKEKEEYEVSVQEYREAEKKHLEWSTRLSQVTLALDRLPVIKEGDDPGSWTRADSQALKSKQTELETLWQDVNQANQLKLEVDHHLKEKKRLEDALAKAENSLKTIEAGTCPTCGQELHDDDLLSRNEAKVREAEKALREHSKGYPGDPPDFSALQENVLSLQQEIKELSARKDRVDEYAETARLIEKRKELQEQETAIQDEEPPVPVDPGPFPGEAEMKQLQNEILLYSQKEKELESVRKHNKKILQEKRADQKKLQAKEQERLDKLSAVQIHTQAASLLSKEFLSHLIASGMAHIESKMNAFFQKTYGGKYTVSLKHSKKSVDFTYKSPKKDIEVPVNLASGFEQALLAIAFRLALCSRQPLGMMVIDEIDSDASDANSLKLFQNLLAEPGFNQFFVITHNPNTLAYLENEPGASIFRLQDGRVEI